MSMTLKARGYIINKAFLNKVNVKKCSNVVQDNGPSVMIWTSSPRQYIVALRAALYICSLQSIQSTPFSAHCAGIKWKSITSSHLLKINV